MQDVSVGWRYYEPCDMWCWVMEVLGGVLMGRICGVNRLGVIVVFCCLMVPSFSLGGFSNLLFLAAGEGSVRGVWLLVRLHVADPNYPQQRTGFVPLHVASFWGYHRIVELLLRAGAHVDVSGGIDRMTPLHFAAGQGRAGVVRTLLDAGATVDSISNYGQTPLHQAAFEGHGDVVRQLLCAGARRDSADKEGRTPQRLAAMNGHDDVVQLLSGAERISRCVAAIRSDGGGGCAVIAGGTLMNEKTPLLRFPSRLGRGRPSSPLATSGLR